ncbi:MAG TPA: CocE/NonD family hydrolase [Actinocrinis sp.]|nr:CocE/NonD family hydrolase [Actinocrinis sp.]
MHDYARLSGRRRLAALAVALLTALTTAIGAGIGAGTAQAATASVANADVTLTMSDGVGLTGVLTQPATPGPHPAIVFIASWGTPDLEYVSQAQQFAQDGYIVLEYDARGFYGSGGSIDVAGPQDVADVSTVIDWLLANTSASPAEIGVGGISYGAGLGLLAAANDPRIKAVASMSTWTDLDYSLYPDQTRHLESTDLLAALGAATGRLSPDFQQILSDFDGNTDISQVLAWGSVRSPQTHVSKINANGTAVFLSNGLQDSIFAPNQLTPFYDDLTTPKFLMLQPGDHATAEASGLLGLSNPIWTNVHAWFDHYLTGANNGITAKAPVQVEPVDGSSYTGYASPAEITSYPATLDLGSENWLGTGSIGSSPSTGWSTGIAAGSDTCADGGTLEVTGILTQFFDSPPTCWLPAISRRSGAVWQSSALGSTDHVRGNPTLNITITPSASTGTIYAYLYDVNWSDDGTLVSYLPYTYANATPGKPLTVNAQLLTAAYDIPAGDTVGLVIDTKDPLFYDADRSGSTVSFSSPAGSPATLTLPLS